MEYDVFICHASEDKDFVEPLAQALQAKGLKVWYDRFQLKLGDSLRQEIDRGLANSKYGIVVLSRVFFEKNWPQSELDALANRQNEEGRKVILPIWHKIEADEVRQHSPLLHGLLAARSADGSEAVVGQILEVCQQSRTCQTSVFQTTEESSLREQCLEVLRRDDKPGWQKLISKLNDSLEADLIKWKEDGEAAIATRSGEAWRSSVIRAIEICLPRFVPLFSAIEGGKKSYWSDSTRVLHRLSLLRDKMGGGTVSVLQIGESMLYVPGTIGMAIAVEIRQHEFIWDWMALRMPGFRLGEETVWGDVRAAFWPPFGSDFQFALSLYDYEHVRSFFPSRERMKELLFKSNLLQSIAELSILTKTTSGSKTVEAHDRQYKVNLQVMPLWCLTSPQDFHTWAWDLFGSSEGFLRFFRKDRSGIDEASIWMWWRGWKEICEACMYAITQGGWRAHTGWLMLPGEPQ